MESKLKKICIAIVLLLGLCSVSRADTCAGINSPLIGFNSEHPTISTSALPLTESAYNSQANVGGGGGAVMAVITTENDTMRFRTDGTAPTSSVGHQVAAGSTLVICGAQNIRLFKAIRSGSSDVVLQVSYFGN